MINLTWDGWSGNEAMINLGLVVWERGHDKPGIGGLGKRP